MTESYAIILRTLTHNLTASISALVIAAAIMPPVIFGQRAEASSDAAEAYIYGYPLVVMDLTRKVMTNTAAPANFGRAPINQFAHVRVLPLPFFRTVVRPNVDTVYSSAWLDLAAEPLVLKVPRMADRYYIISMLDAWTESFAAPSSLSSRGAEQIFLIAGPGWRGVVPAGMTLLRSPTNIAWILARIAHRGEADLPNVRTLQHRMMLVPWSVWNGHAAARASFTYDSSLDMVTAPKEQIDALPAVDFFSRLDDLMRRHADLSSAVDSDTESVLRRLGIGGEQRFDPSRWSGVQSRSLDEGVATARLMIANAWHGTGRMDGPWRVLGESGHFGRNYLGRAAVAWGYLGIVDASHAYYAMTDQDSLGRDLVGTRSVMLRIPAAEMPQHQGFWSVTLYTEDGFLHPNESRRYSVSSLTSPALSPDGSVEIVVQADRPTSLTGINWLPAPSGRYNLALRIYAPDRSITTGSWRAPGIFLFAPTATSR